MMRLARDMLFTLQRSQFIASRMKSPTDGFPNRAPYRAPAGGFGRWAYSPCERIVPSICGQSKMTILSRQRLGLGVSGHPSGEVNGHSVSRELRRPGRKG